MKRIILPSLLSIALSITATISSNAQTGPGGVGDSANNILWLDASSLNLNDGDPVSTWTDISGNGNDAFQNNAANQPVYRATGLNNKSIIEFVDGGNDYLSLLNNINTSEITVFLVYNHNRKWLLPNLELGKYNYTTNNNLLRLEFSDTIKTLYVVPRSYNVVGFSSNANTDTGQVDMWSRSNFVQYERGALMNNTNSYIGYHSGNVNSAYKYFRGKIGEVIIYNTKLNSAQRKIVSEYLGTKFQLTSESNFYSYKSTHSYNLIGIGQESDGSNTVANDRDKLNIANPTQLNNGDYFLAAHNDSGFTASTNVPPGYTSRWKQTWRVDETGEVGLLDFELAIGSDGLTTSGNYVLLVDNDGDFTNGGSRSYDLSGSSIFPVITLEFDEVNINNGEFFTLAKKMSGIESITDGSWSDPTTWNCACVPSSTDNVNINHSVIIDNNVNVLTAELNNNGTLIFTGSDTLFVHGNFENNGSFISGNGTVAAVGDVVQTFFNSTLNTVELNNLLVNNDSGLNIASGDWAIRNNIQVLSGILKNNGANSITFISNASTNSQILPSVEDAFEGDFVVQRFISERHPNFANISSPISNGTFHDLDDDLYLSGTNGPDSNTTVNGTNDIFYSLYSFNTRTDLHDTIMDLNTPMIPTYGYEVYLISRLVRFDATVVDFVGTPNSGNQSLTYNNIISQGWNLIGNPYHAHIEFDSLLSNNIANSYYIFNSNNGAYELISGTSKRPIAPSQAFWVYRSNGGGYYITFQEQFKLDNNSNAFYRRKNIDERISLRISSLENGYNQSLYLDFDVNATANFDEKDIPILHSPIKEAPAIYSKAVNSKEELVVNSNNPTEKSHLLPVSIYAGVEGKHEINADNLDALYENYSCVYLKDNETEEAIDLMVEPRYSFEAKQGKSDRFHLILSNSYEECQEMIENGSFTQKLDTKVSLRNAYDNWYLDYTLGEAQTQLEIRVYNMSGQEVKAPMSFEAHGAGTYPLQHLNDLEGIYLIQVIGKDVFLNKQVKL